MQYFWTISKELKVFCVQCVFYAMNLLVFCEDTTSLVFSGSVFSVIFFCKIPILSGKVNINTHLLWKNQCLIKPERYFFCIYKKKHYNILHVILL